MIPKPFFVHSDLTSLVQVADLIAYVIAWGLRIPGQMQAPRRDELEPFAEQVDALQYSTRRRVHGETLRVWGFKVIRDLRGWEDQLAPA